MIQSTSQRTYKDSSRKGNFTMLLGLNITQTSEKKFLGKMQFSDVQQDGTSTK